MVNHVTSLWPSHRFPALLLNPSTSPSTPLSHLSPRRQSSILSPRRQSSSIPSPRRQSSILSPRRQSSSIPSPRRQSSILSPRRQSSIPSPRRQSSSIPSPRRQSSIPSPRRQSSSIPSPRRQSSILSPRRQSSIPSPRRPSSILSPRRQPSSIPSPRRQSSILSPRRQSSSIPSPRRQSSILSPRRQSSSIPSPRRQSSILSPRRQSSPSRHQGDNPPSHHQGDSPSPPRHPGDFGFQNSESLSITLCTILDGPRELWAQNSGLSDRATDHHPMLFVHRPVGRPVTLYWNSPQSPVPFQMDLGGPGHRSSFTSVWQPFLSSSLSLSKLRFFLEPKKQAKVLYVCNPRTILLIQLPSLTTPCHSLGAGWYLTRCFSCWFNWSLPACVLVSPGDPSPPTTEADSRRDFRSPAPCSPRFLSHQRPPVHGLPINWMRDKMEPQGSLLCVRTCLIHLRSHFVFLMTAGNWWRTSWNLKLPRHESQ